MAKNQLSALAPSAKNLRRVRRRVRVWSFLFEIIASRWMKLTVSGLEQIPKAQPILILTNHTGFFDPLIVGRAVRQEVIFLATESNFREGLLGRFFVYFGAVPKMKYTADLRAIITLKRWAEAGANIGLFPEGERTWDGRRLPLVPGIEKLARLLGLPLVIMRIYNGFRQSPRWAPHFRRGRIHVEIDPPYKLDSSVSLEDIRSHIEQGITVDALEGLRFPVKSKGLSVGITNVAWACPTCFRIEGLKEDFNKIQCWKCNSQWQIDSDSQFVGEGKTPSYTLPQVVDRIRAHHSNLTNNPSNGYEPLIQSPNTTVKDISGSYPKIIGQGKLKLTKDMLYIEGSLPWKIPIHSLETVTVDMRRRLTFRIGQRYLEAVIPNESVLKWEWFLHYLKASTRH